MCYIYFVAVTRNKDCELSSCRPLPSASPKIIASTPEMITPTTSSVHETKTISIIKCISNKPLVTSTSTSSLSNKRHITPTTSLSNKPQKTSARPIISGPQHMASSPMSTSLMASTTLTKPGKYVIHLVKFANL